MERTAAGKAGEVAPRVVTTNRRARHDYHILATLEAGIVLSGTEVKSLRAGAAQLRDSYATVEGGEVLLHNAHISPYEPGTRYNHDPDRTRRLLLHKSQILRLAGRVQQQGLTLVPLRIYFSRGKAKVELALARGKKQYDRRESIARRDANRDMERALSERRR